MPALTLSSPAKINLHLRVAPPDASGYHPLRSWMITTTLCDELVFDRNEQKNAPPLTFECDDPTIPCDGSNLVCRAASALLRDGADPLAVRLIKRIPAGAGLGGGSGNAAMTLRGVNRLLGLGLSIDDLLKIAATLGSDVPFFLGAPSAIATGRGERLDPCPAPQTARFAVLIFPPFPISTPAAYRTLDAMRPTADESVLDPFDAVAWSDLPARDLLANLVNDLELAAFAIEPKLAALHRAAEIVLKQPIRMSGSGSTLFSLFDDREASTRAAAIVAEKTGVGALPVEVGNSF